MEGFFLNNLKSQLKKKQIVSIIKNFNIKPKKKNAFNNIINRSVINAENNYI